MNEREELERLRKLKRLRELEAKAAGGTIPDIGNARAEAGGGGQGYLSGMVDAVTQGAAFGFGDEATALESAVLGRSPGGGTFDLFNYDAPFSERYDRALEAERAQQAAFRESNPVSSTAGEIAGAVGTAILTPIGALGAAKAGAPLLSNMGRSAAAGAGLGAAYGFGSGEGGFENRAASAAGGAALGGIAGAAVPAAAAGVRNLAARRAANRGAAQAGMTRPAYSLLRETLADDTAMGGGVARIARAGDDAMLADSGPGSAALLDAVGQMPGGRQTVGPAVNARAAAVNQQAAAVLDDTLGAARSVSGGSRALRQATAGARQAGYDAAYAQSIDFASEAGQALDDLLARVPPRALREANKLLAVENLPRIHEGVRPTVQQLDYVKRALDGMARSGEGQGAMGGQTPLGRAYEGLARQLRDTLAAAVPQYDEALRTAADPIRRRQAMEFGYRMLRPSVLRNEVDDVVGGMTPAERAEAGRALRAYISDTVANVRAAASDPNMDARVAAKALKDLSSGAARDKIRTLVGKETADTLFAELDRLGMAFDLRAAIAQNSKTAPRQALQNMISDQVDEGIVNAARQGRPLRAGQTLWQRLAGGTPADQQAAASRYSRELAQVLTGPRGAEAQRLARMLLEQAQRDPARAEAVGRLTQQLLMPTRAGAAPAGLSLIQQ